jgi:hypothetical protein
MAAMNTLAAWYVWQKFGLIRVVKLAVLLAQAVVKVGLKHCVLLTGQKQMHVIQKDLNHENWT